MTKAELRTIVLIDDEPDIRTIGRLSLERVGGWTVHAAASGTQGIAAAREHRPELILLDVMMPGMDGPETLSHLRQIPGLEATPVIFVTAKAMPSEIEHFISLGALGVIVKPFDPEAICDEISALVAAAG